MSTPTVRLGFFKLNVPEMAPALAFWREAFGFTVSASFDEQKFVEHILGLPGQEAGPNLMLVCYKDKRDLAVGSAHGPVGLVCDDIKASYAQATRSGARALTGIFEVGVVKVAMLASPQGHEIELIELPAG